MYSEDDLSIGYTTGVFDLFHIGHLNLLKRARQLCDQLTVGVTTDSLVEKEKGRPPIIPFSERIEIVKSIRHVDRVVPQHSYDKFSAWEQLRFNRMFVGDDWKGHPRWLELEKTFSRVNVSIIYLPYTLDTSSTSIRKLIEKTLRITY